MRIAIITYALLFIIGLKGEFFVDKTRFWVKSAYLEYLPYYIAHPVAISLQLGLCIFSPWGYLDKWSQFYFRPHYYYFKHKIFLSKKFEFSYSFHSLPAVKKSQRKLLEVGLDLVINSLDWSRGWLPSFRIQRWVRRNDWHICCLKMTEKSVRTLLTFSTTFRHGFIRRSMCIV